MFTGLVTTFAKAGTRLKVLSCLIQTKFTAQPHCSRPLFYFGAIGNANYALVRQLRFSTATADAVLTFLPSGKFTPTATRAIRCADIVFSAVVLVVGTLR